MITHVAIRDRLSGKVYSVPAPGRHNDVIALMVREGYSTVKSSQTEQGFIFDGRFVGRREAKFLAKPQLLESASESDLLFSEDLW